MAALVCLAVGVDALPEERRYGQAHQLERNGRYADAVRAFEEVAATDSPLKYYASVRAAVSRGLAGDAEGARELLAHWSRELPDGPIRAYALFEYGKHLHEASDDVAAEAALRQALEPDLNLWWQFGVRWELAESRLRVPGLEPVGWDFFRDAAQTAVWRQERLDAAAHLVEGPDLESRLIAADTLLVYNRFREAADIIARLELTLPEGSPEAGRLDWLRARALLGLDQRTQARTLLEHMTRAYEGTEWGRVGLGVLARDYARKGEYDRAEFTLQRLDAAYPNSDEGVEVRRTLAAAYGRRGEDANAIRHLTYIATAKPENPYADDALMEIGHLHQDAGRLDAAREAWEELFERYPGSELAVETAVHLGDVERAEGRDRDAARHYQFAAERGMGDYYGFRAAQRRKEIRDGRVPRAHELELAYSTYLVRPMPVENLARAAAFDRYAEDPRFHRLAFFALYGMPEAEWEALYLLDEAQSSADAAGMYQAIGEAGTAYSTMQVAAAQRFGDEADGSQTPERLRIRYPRAYWPYVSALGKESGIDPYLILSIARQESTYRPALISHAGATGVLQLMPATADWLVGLLDEIEHRHAMDLQNPSNSFRLGTYYFKYLLERYDGNYVYAIAAYNGGPGNVNKWRRAFGSKSLEDFIEDIPFTETRNYVKRVLANWATYHSLYEPAE